ncbi:MAG: hypothetical protein IIY09_02605, partial [Clostridia bacterium]|nr:hypothetical protein [Clostridia bacterium]
MKKLGKIVSLFLATVLSVAAVSTLVACGGGGKKAKSLIIMTDSLDGLFNPFYSTSANDGTIAGMTQIGMLSTDKTGEITFGDDEPVVVKDFERVYNAATDKTDYTFVIKNGIVFSDGKPLTMNDVLFNMYVYLDPVYTGSTTMYSTDIVGLYEYRYQESETATGEEELTKLAASYARIRLQELIRVYQTVGKKISSGSVTYEADVATMEAAIMDWNLSSSYKSAVSTKPEEVTNDQLLADYRNVLTKFRQELERDYEGAKDAYVEDPYKSTGEF